MICARSEETIQLFMICGCGACGEKVKKTEEKTFVVRSNGQTGAQGVT